MKAGPGQPLQCVMLSRTAYRCHADSYGMANRQNGYVPHSPLTVVRQASESALSWHLISSLMIQCVRETKFQLRPNC